MNRSLRAQEPASARSRALTAAFVTVVVWSSAFVGIRFALREIPPGSLVFLRFTVASACFASLFAIGRVRWPARRDLPALLFLGLLGQAAYQFALSSAQTRITAGVAGVLIAFVPVLSALLAVPILGERLSARKWWGMALAFAGVVLISFGASDHIGLEPMALLGLLAAAASAGYFVLQKPFLTRYGALDLTAYGVWTCMAATSLFAPELPRLLADVSSSTLFAVVYLGIVPTAVGYTLWAYALARASASQVSSFLYLEPVATFLLAWLLLSEVPTAAAILGAGLAVAGVALVNGKQSD